MFELAFVYFMVVETRGLTLEETAALFDGDDLVQHVSGGIYTMGAKEVHQDEKNYEDKLDSVQVIPV